MAERGLGEITKIQDLLRAAKDRKLPTYREDMAHEDEVWTILETVNFDISTNIYRNQAETH